MSVLEQLGMGAETEERNGVARLVKPHQEEIALNVTFHAALIFAFEWVRAVFFRQLDFVAQLVKDRVKLFELLWLVEIAFQVFLELTCVAQLLYNPIDLSMELTLVVSIGPSSSPRRASLSDAMVVSLGS